MQVVIGADHRGFPVKEHLKEFLIAQGHQVVDVGNVVLDPQDDYPLIGFAVAEQVTQLGEEARGVVICGSGVGIAIAANKVVGVRCALGFSSEQIAAARKDDDVNVLAVAADYFSPEQIEEQVTSFLTTAFDPQERYIRRIQQIQERERASQ